MKVLDYIWAIGKLAGLLLLLIPVGFMFVFFVMLTWNIATG